MRILVIGSERNLAEVSARLGAYHSIDFLNAPPAQDGLLPDCDVLFDFRIHERSTDCRKYLHTPYVFLNSVFITLERLSMGLSEEISGHWFGFNGLPTFFTGNDLEVCLREKSDVDVLSKICAKLQVGFTLVRDQVGMVTPRVISMIINEAYFTFAEGTASRADIDLAMKLGTNYPYGPFEWCERIGAADICKVLEALGSQNLSSRFRICPVLADESEAATGD